MYWPLTAGFSGVCARETKNNGAERTNRIASNRRVIFIRERILTLTAEVVRAQHSFAYAQEKLRPYIGRSGGVATFSLLPALLAGRRRRQPSLPLRGVANERLVSSAPLRESRSRGRG